jgi:hypothetical protein
MKFIHSIDFNNSKLGNEKNYQSIDQDYKILTC